MEVNMNFDQVIDRKNTKSLKWHGEMLKERFGDQDILPMWVADMDFKVCKEITEAIIEEAKTGIYGYSIRKDTYYDAVINWYQKRFDWSIDVNWIMNTSGIVPAVGFALDAYTKEGEQTLIQEPVYFPFKSMVLNHDRTVINNALIKDDAGYHVDFEDFEMKVKDEKTKLFILCSPHNPIGKVWSKEELTKMADLCIENNVLIFSDEIHHDLVFPGEKHCILSDLKDHYKDHVITATAPSKTFNLAGMQSSHMIIPNEKLRVAFQKVLNRIHLTPPNPLAVSAVEAAYSHGEDWLEALLKYLEANVKIIDSFLKEQLPKARFIKPQGTYLAWIDLSAYGENIHETLVKKGKIALNNGKMFGSGGNGYVRLNFACPQTTLQEGLNRMKTALDT
jgi:cystathionine beta-lyase